MNAKYLRSLIEKLNVPTRGSLEAAIAFCVSRTHYAVEVEHVVAQLCEADTDWAQALAHFQIDTSRLMRDVQRALDRLQSGNTRGPTFARSVLRWLGDAWLCASVGFGAPQVRSGHLLLAGLRSSELEPLLRQCSGELEKVSLEVIEQKLFAVCAGSAEDRAATNAQPAAAEAAPSGASGGALDRFTTDLTARARAGKIDHVLGRDAEIRQITEILLRYRQNNPILVGEAGVGKTALVEGLAQKIARGEVPEALREVSIRVLDLGLLQAGAGVRGEFEARLKGVLDEVKAAAKPIIVFIDEAHTMIGAGGQTGQNDAANLLKPALARGELRAIAATTWAEYKQYFEDDAALSRRFQPVKVSEPSEHVAQVMLRGLVPTLERHHNLRIMPDAVEAAVRLAQRYIADRQLPDKAVSVLSTACARVALSQQALPGAIDDHRCRIKEINAETDLLLRDGEHAERLTELAGARAAHEQGLEALERRWQQELELVGHIRAAREKSAPTPADERAGQADQAPPTTTLAETAVAHELIERWRRELQSMQGEQPLVYDCVSSQAVAEVVATWTGVPIGKMVRDELHTIIKLDAILAERVVGQDHALRAIAQRIATSRAEMEPPNRPIGVFLLVGPSGVGKTETALALASTLYGGERNVITINMAEYKEPHSVAGLKGAPPGYVGYGKGGILTEAVRRRPYSIVLLDEFEKAHKEVKQMFYAVFDTGLLNDTSGREVSFRNTVILLTSNVASRKISGLCGDPQARPTAEQLLTVIRPDLIEAFEEALLGRMTPIPYFPLDATRLRAIVGLQLGKVRERLLTRHKAALEYSEDVVEALCEHTDTSVTGARAIEQTISRELLTGLSHALLERMAEAQPVAVARLSVHPDRSLQFELI